MKEKSNACETKAKKVGILLISYILYIHIHKKEYNENNTDYWWKQI